MTEAEFREFLLQNTRNWPAVEIENMIVRASPDYFRGEAKKAGKSITEEQTNALASLLRKQVATSIAMYKNGTASKDDVLNYRIEKLPDDFPL